MSETGPDDAAAVGRRILALRQAAGMRQADLAGEHISVAYVSRLESGQRQASAAVLAEIAERLGTTTDFLRLGVEPERAAEAQLALRQAELLVATGDTDAGALELRAVLAQHDGLSAQDVARAQIALASVLEARGELDEAIDVLGPAVADVTAGRIDAVIALCRCYREVGDFTRAIEVGERALEQLEALGLRDDDDAIRLEVTVAGAYLVRGDLSHAARMCREAAARAQRSGSPMARAAAYWNASSIAGERGDTHRAVELASRALTLLGEGEDARNLARLRGELGLLMVADGESSVREAASLLRRARQDLRRAGASQVDEARCDLGLARCALLEQDLDAAERHALAARPKATAVPVAHADADVVLGRVAAARGDVAQALECYRAATRTLTGVMADRAVAQAWYELGALLDEAGDAAGARDAYRSAAAASGLQPTRDARPLFSSLASR